MIRAGFTFTNPLTSSQLTLIESDVETNGMGFFLEMRCVPNGGPDVVEHVHQNWSEHFAIVSGTAAYQLNGVRHTAQAGDSFVVAPGQRHIHPWNAGNTELVYRQRSTFAHSSPAAVQDTMGVFATLADLARAGKVDKRGLPKDPLQLAVTIKTLAQHNSYSTDAPVVVQKILAVTLGRVALMLGYRGVDLRFVSDN
jgi:mannose-6-phosphate isomerase-like protein (cupin superfamily)